MRYFVYLVITIVLFSGCSVKNVFKPTNVINEMKSNIQDMPSDIKSFKLNKGITLLDGSVIVPSGLLKDKLPKGFNLLNYNENKIIAVNNHKLLIGSDEKVFSQEIISATLKDNLLALGFIDNSIAIYDMNTEKIVFKESYEHSFLNNINIANPYFMDNMILFPTLDGKVIVVAIDTKKIIRNLIVSSSDDIKNIIFISVVGDNLITASSDKIISIGNGTIDAKEYNISSIVTTEKYIYITTVDGRIIKLDVSLNKVLSKKYKFAKFVSMLYHDGYVYALEAQGYIVAIDDDFSQDYIYSFDFDNTKYTTVINDTIYFEDKYLEIK
jgi:WD40 repeat protein